MSMRFDAITNSCLHSDLVEPHSIHPRPDEYFWTLPIHVSRYNEEIHRAGHELLTRWHEALKADGLGMEGFEFHGGPTTPCNFTSCAFPETRPERLVLLTEVSDFGFYWDDITDALSVEKNKEITQDLAVVFLAELKLGQRLEPKLEISKMVVQIVRGILDQDRELGLNMINSWKGHLDGQAASTHNDMSFEQYKGHRLGEVGAFWGIELGCWGADVHVTQEEKNSVRSFLDPGLIAVMLTNDYYSFNKEVAEHQRTGTLHRMQNGVGLLMREYGYAEDEARSIVKQEILDGERRLMEGYHLWEQTEGSKPGAHELRRYIAVAIFMIGGSSFWISHTSRYNREDLTSTPEQRAAITGQPGQGLRVLEGYPPPRALQKVDKPLELPTTNNVRSNGVAQACDAPFEYINSLPGKGMRNLLVEALNSWLHVPPESLQIIKNVIQALHNSSLMLDDVEDNSALRRGQPATHIFYGVSQTVNSATSAYVKTVQDILQLQNKECLNIFIEELINLHHGQGLELFWSYHGRCPSISEYLTMIDNKTGRLFQLMFRLMQAESSTSTFSSPTSTSVAHLLTLAGRYYQIRDDYLNLTSAEYTTKKGFCEDLDEGKFSLPLIHLLSHTPHPDRITGALFHRIPGTSGVTQEVKAHILQAMEKARTFDYVRGVLTFVHKELLRLLGEVEAEMGSNPGLRVLLLGMAL
ncbi:isoprenoid synthase domain-containing protein [Aspergillus egyptiacus]|nr:isoprenoid synthase domain-containing protein [Aspergillus egyptiacus]